MFLRNYWYAGVLSTDVADKPFARKICNEPIVFFRTASGKIGALEDRCSHRHAPLSLGAVRGETIECGYHGFMFDCAGACMHIPGQKSVPPRAAIRSYPIVERAGWIWVWIGDPARADESRLPDLPWFGAQGWQWWHCYYHGKAAAQLYMDNLLDITHTAYLHQKTIGTPEVPDQPPKVRTEGTRVTVNRLNKNATPAPFVAKWGGFPGKIDAYTDYTWEPPSLIKLRTTRTDGVRTLQYWLTNAVTPETETTAHFWFAWACDQHLDDPGFKEQTYKGIAGGVLLEDFAMIEAQQRTMREWNGLPQIVPSQADAPLVAVHKVLKELFARQAAEENSGAKDAA